MAGVFDPVENALACAKPYRGGANVRQQRLSHPSGQDQANYAPLTPLTFLERAAYVYPDKPAVVYGAERYTWKQTYARCRRLASALARRGIGKNDTVAIMAPNTPPMYEARSACRCAVPC